VLGRDHADRAADASPRTGVLSFGERRRPSPRRFRRAIDIDRAHAPAYYKWAALERGRGNVGRARELLQQGVWACSGAARARELAKLHRARGELEAESTLRRFAAPLRRRRPGDAAAAGAAPPWSAAADDARDAFRSALAAEPAAATFAAWARFETALGEAARARALLEDGLATVGGEPAIWREFVAFERARAGDAAAAAAEARARAALAAGAAGRDPDFLGIEMPSGLGPFGLDNSDEARADAAALAAKAKRARAAADARRAAGAAPSSS